MSMAHEMLSGERYGAAFIPRPMNPRAVVGTTGPHEQRSNEMQQTSLDIYGSEPIPWSRARDQLQDDSTKKTYWLATVRPDGRPHVAGVGALWLDEKIYFTSGGGTRKRREQG